MSTQDYGKGDQHKHLTEIKERLRAGKLTPADVSRLEQIVSEVENAARSLRAAIVE